MKNIFLTGNIQVGKSTILKSFLTNFSGVVGGFITQPFFTPNNERLFVLTSLNNFTKVKRDAKLICRPSKKDGRLEPLTDTFEDLGVKILEECLRYGADVIIMDELGIFESEAKNFQKTVHKCLNSPIPVLGVIKKRESIFLNLLRSRNDILLLNITQENRKEQKEVFIHKCHKILKK